MGRSRCTMKVEGLDCPVEAGALQDALAGTAGVDRLDFDLIHGTMTVHYLDEATGPSELLRRVARTGMTARPIEETRPDEGRSGRLRRWLPTLAAGSALLVGFVLPWLGADARLSTFFYAAAIVAGGIDLFPSAIRSAARRQLDIHVLMGLAVLGRGRPRPVGRGGDGRVPVRTVGIARGAERQPGAFGDPGPARGRARPRRADRRRRLGRDDRRGRSPAGGSGPRPGGVAHPGRRDGRDRPVERGPEGDHGRVEAGRPRAGR